MELAIAKYAPLKRGDDICPSLDCELDEILGGKFIETKELYPLERFDFDSYANDIKNSDQWVLRDFTTEDFLDAFRIEGLAHNLWHLGAMRRTISKVGTVTFMSDGRFRYNHTPDESFLVKSIDSRQSFLSLPLGSVMNIGESESNSPIIIAQYNWEKIQPGTNFCIQFIDQKKLYDSISFLEPSFFSEHGISIKRYLFLVSRIHAYFHLTCNNSDRFFYSLLTRGYYCCQKESLIEYLKTELQSFTLEEIDDLILQFLKISSLTETQISKINFHTRGPSSFLFDFDKQVLVDVGNWMLHFEDLFHTVRPEDENQNQVGDEFHKSVASRIQKEGFQLLYSSIPRDGEKPLTPDVITRIGSTIFMIECTAIRYGFSLEAGDQNKMKERINKKGGLSKKVQQAMKYERTVANNLCRYRGYKDWGDFDNVISILVSPFKEWIWEKSDDLWIDDKTPRILSPNEMIEYLKKTRDQRE